MMRTLRAASFAAVCVALTAAGHGFADGHPIGPAVVGVGFVAVFAAARAGARRERSGAEIIAGLFAGQVGLHLLFCFARDPAGFLGYAESPDHTGSMVMAPASGDMAHDSGWGMIGAHLAAAVVVGWWLRRGEAACWRLLRRAETATAAVGRAALALLARIVALPAADHAQVAIRDVMRHERCGAITVLQVRCVPRRGPPGALRLV